MESTSDDILTKLERIAASLERIANKLDPPPSAKVGTAYVAGKLGCTTTWIAEMIRKGRIPPSCIVPGSGIGKVWRLSFTSGLRTGFQGDRRKCYTGKIATVTF